MADQWPNHDSPTGRQVFQGSGSYRPDDVAREERERELNFENKTAEEWIKEQHHKMLERAGQKEREQEIRHVYSDFDPNFGDYNIPPGGNHP